MAERSARPVERTEVLPIRGMTCRACEVRVGKALRGVPGVRSAQVSAVRGTAQVTLERPVQPRALEAAIARAGYEVGADRRPWLSRDRAVWRDVLLAVAAVLAVLVLARVTGLEALVPSGVGTSATGSSSTSLAVVLVLGLAAGVSTCLALVGGLVLAVAARHAERHPDLSPAARLRPHLAFGVGRVVGFALGGAVLGALGSAITIGAGTAALVALVVAAGMVLLGLQLTQVSPRLSRFTIALPEGLSRRLGLDGRAEARYSDAGTAGLGAASFLLPCGFTQAVQLFALSTGDPIRAAVVMAVFAVGTAPGLLALGGVVAAVKRSAVPRFLRFAGVAVLAFAAVTAGGALTVLAPGLRAPAAAAPAGTPLDSTREGDVQVLRTTQVGNGYEPAVARVAVGVPVRWEINSVAASCASALYAPALGLGTVLLESGVNVLEFTPTEVGRLPYTCAMGMYTGAIDVVEPGG